MTKQVELLDSLPGTGKTSAILRCMADDQTQPWLYISPMLEEVEERVVNQASELGLQLYVPYKDDLYTKSQTSLTMLKQGKNVCCTHNLMYRFSKQHIQAIKDMGYRVVSDEELNLIQGYSIKSDDIDFLISNNIIEIKEDGMVVFLDEDMSLDARYGEIKAHADLGMLYSAKRNKQMMVIQLSPKLIDAAERFILLTYNYKGSIMQVFLDLHGYTYKDIEGITLFRTNEDVKKVLEKRINLIESPSLKRIQTKYPLSKSWWVSASKEQRQEISKAMVSLKKTTQTPQMDLFYTLPKDYATASKGFDTNRLGNETTNNFVACNSRSTNKYKDKTLAMHAYNLYPNQAVKAFIQDNGLVCNEDGYAINMFLQWLFRGCIRKNDNTTMQVAIFSKRMETLFKSWLCNLTN
jgi:hypothetical protein